MSGDFLSSMARHSEARVHEAQAREGAAALRDRAAKMPSPPALRLSDERFDLIAEVKLRSPSAGRLSGPADAGDLAERAVRYATAGAAAVSVLTEDSRFDGSLDHLQTVAAALRPHNVPAMRKDFLVDPYQVFEARAAGAGGVLLILAMLSDDRLHRMLDAAAETGLFVLLEAFDETDLARSSVASGRADVLVGLNCRDLRTLRVDTGRFAALAGKFPAGAIPVAESGIANAADACAMAAEGYRAALVGTALMRTPDPGVLLEQMLQAGRSAAAA